MKRRTLLLFVLVLLTGCTQFHTGRTYLSEMEQDDSRFFQPDSDFPVVMGDSGEMGISDEERTARTPASLHDMRQRNFRRSLADELRELQESQTEEGQRLYENYEDRLATTSEKIYFLKLPPHERKDYLRARGFLGEEKVGPESGPRIRFGLRNQEIGLGMSKADVMENWGKPLRVDVAGNPSFENERWAYRLGRNTKYIYFESGAVQGWE